MSTDLSRWERLILLRILPTAVFVLFVTTVYMGTLIQGNDDNIDALGTSVDSVSRSTQHLERFVSDLEDETPGEAERNAAITRAVELVPAIREILCEQFPDAAACAVP